MVERKSIRPVTLRRVIEICSLATKTKVLDSAVVVKELGVSPSRAKEIILEVKKMGLLRHLGEVYLASDKTTNFLNCFENERWDRIHEYFLSSYQFYQDFIRVLQDHIDDDKGLSTNEIKEESVSRQLSLNQTAVEVLSDWCDRLGVIQRNLYTRRLYLANNKIDLKVFRTALVKCYHELSLSHGRKGVFVEIPTVRENLCEALKIPRKIFDEMLRFIYLENVGRVELSGAPITTLAKRSPLGEKKMKHEAKDAIMSPKFEVAKEREGLLIGHKAYYYLAIHEGIS